ncbi:Putative Receptor L-domain superfamily [Colletotrichum destructivum]|uniref:Receptor L-domain superfamily n=1 Tax=Colletotrichum destructivum TaxID=34406 RepID=A0AAX4IZN0_9PEZI|nr:Putative Receptor L-domain superfamily [Colletotrichum destructivum]
MIGFSKCLQAGAFTVIALCHGVLGQVCDFPGKGLLIKQPGDADALRNCREVNGNLVISPVHSADIDLSGPEVIHGSIFGDEYHSYSNSSVNIASTTLTRVDGHLTIIGRWYITSIQNLSFPNLQTVGGTFALQRPYGLTYVDVTNLHTVGSIEIIAPELSTLKHTALRSVGPSYDTQKIARTYGLQNGILIGTTSLESVDSIFNNNIKVESASFTASTRVKRLVVGFKESAKLVIYGADDADAGQLEVVLGGESTTSMHIGEMQMQYAISGFRRSPNLQNLTADKYYSAFTNMTHLHLPFDQLGSLYLEAEEYMTWVSVPPQAAQWSNFSLTISRTEVNLTSEYMPDEKGGWVRSWYWPQKDMFSVDIGSGNLTPAFFESFLEYQKATVNTTSQPKVLHEFRLNPYNIATFDCEPFKKLAEQGIIGGLGCYSWRKDSSAYSWRETSVLSSTWSAVAIAAIVYFTAL